MTGTRMEPTPRISVVIPTYNRASLLEATVRAVLAQTLPAAEIVVVDDGSADDTEAVCSRFPATVRYVRQENTGLPGARNRGIEESTGEWVAFCDSDDLWHPRKLEIQMAALRAVPAAGWCLTGCDLIDPEGRAIDSPISGLEYVFRVLRQKGERAERHLSTALAARAFEAGGRHVVLHGDLFELLFQGNVALPSSAVVSRALIVEAGPFDPRFLAAEDTEFFHRISAFSPVAYLTEPLVEYRTGHASMNSTMDPAPFIRNALESLDRAAGLRSPLRDSERRAYREGKRALRLHLAYCRLSVLDRAGARAALRDLWREDRRASTPLVGILVASLLPPALLRWLHRVKSSLRRTLAFLQGFGGRQPTGA